MEVHQRFGMLKTRRCATDRRAEKTRPAARRVIVQVAPDAAQRWAAIDADRLQVLGVADAGAHQQERRTDGPRREHDDVGMQASRRGRRAAREPPATLSTLNRRVPSTNTSVISVRLARPRCPAPDRHPRR